MTDFLTLTNILLLINFFAIIFLVWMIFSLKNSQDQSSHIKNFFSNIKNQGIWGEEQLLNLLNETLSSEQFDVQSPVEPHSEFVVDALIKIPCSKNEHVLLPVDSKLPLEDYMNFLNSNEEINYKNAKKYIKKLESKLKAEAKSIKEKYIKTPYTTDFAIIFLPIESLYYLLIQNTSFVETLRNDYKILLSSPSSLSALIRSVAISFKYSQVETLHRDFYESIELLNRNFEELDLSVDKSEKKIEELYKSISDLKTKTKVMKRNFSNYNKIHT